MKKLFMLVALMMLGLGMLTSCGGREAKLEEKAKSVVSSMIRDMYDNALIQELMWSGPNHMPSAAALAEPPNCLRVAITDKVDDKHYKATATLDNGKDIKIMIEDCGETINVTIIPGR